MDRLATLMKVQALVFAAYALGWFLIPNLVNDTILSWDSGSFWPRMIGGSFFGVALAEWNVVKDLPNRMGLVLPFALIPLGFLAAPKASVEGPPEGQ